MAFLDKLGESITSSSQKVAQKAKELSEVTNLNSQISKQENIVKSSLDELGRLYFQQRKEEVVTAFPEIVEKIDLANAEIIKLKAEVMKVKGLVQCPGCNAEIEAGVKFCPKCGMAQPIVEATEAANKEVLEACPGCGAQVSSETTFCANCGAKIQ